ncbi:MAG: hypothetical protein CTY24_00935 [Methylobacter sp.]|nr:MAG: hypothetical protein CTY24_00935 [Methylobacter sp.]
MMPAYWFPLSGALIVLLMAAVVWLWREVLKLKHKIDQLVEQVEASKHDIAGLCSAAVKVDSRLESTGEQVGELMIKLSEQQLADQSGHPYGGVIQKVRSGASVNELMQSGGLSLDEATLLVRLHGGRH